MRRGANMGILPVDHPDIDEFITCKADMVTATNFNISVGVTATFMKALENNAAYDLVDPVTKKVTGQLEARAVWDKMIEGAWRTGEPGVFFIDEANRYNPVPHLGAYEATNPCGEQPLLPYDVCNLGSINVGYYVENGKMNWESFAADIHVSTHFLDNVIDANKYPLPEIDALSKRIRRIGLGVMGFADALVRLGIPYDSPEGVEFGRKVMEFVDVEGKKASERLAGERGEFPEWAQSIWGPDATCARDAEGKRIRPMQKLRNCNVTTVAPTGTISITFCPTSIRRQMASTIGTRISPAVPPSTASSVTPPSSILTTVPTSRPPSATTTRHPINSWCQNWPGASALLALASSGARSAVVMATLASASVM